MPPQISFAQPVGGNTVTVENLQLITPLQIDTAIAAILTGSRRLIRQAELDVKLESPGEFLPSDDVASASSAASRRASGSPWPAASTTSPRSGGTPR
jgi:hypothetical protein